MLFWELGEASCVGKMVRKKGMKGRVMLLFFVLCVEYGDLCVLCLICWECLPTVLVCCGTGCGEGEAAF